MLSEQQLIELANAVGWTGDEEYDHGYSVTGTGLTNDGEPRVEVGFTDRTDDEEQFVVNLTSLGEFKGREMVRVVTDDNDWITSVSPRGIASMVFNA